MKVRRFTLRAGTVAAVALACAMPLLTPSQAVAQSARQVLVAPSISDFDVTPVRSLQPGTDLVFAVRGTPSAEALVRMTGAASALALTEVNPGEYRGVYTIGWRDRLSPTAPITAELRAAGRVDTVSLGEPIVVGAAAPVSPAVAQLPSIERFAVTSSGEGRVGEPVRIVVRGTPGGEAWVWLPGASTQWVSLNETRSGRYTGSYVVRASDRLDPNTPAVARLTVNGRVATARLNDALAAACADCVTVMAIRRVEDDGGNGTKGAVAGGLLGAVLGSQVGNGDGRTAAGVVGAVGGALIGRELDKRANRDDDYEVVVQTAAGLQQVVRYDDKPDFEVGDTLRLINGTLVAQRN